MKISQAKECIKEIYLNTDQVTALISERGVGKTSAYRQCADELGIGYLPLYAAALEGPDFMGLPDRDNDSGITRYLAPQFLPTAKAVEAGLFPEKGLLVFEEINRVPSDTVSVLYPILLERRINTHELAPGWKIGVTMNPDSLNYSVNALDDALIDRFISLEITANLEEYIIYSLANGPNDEVLSYLHNVPDMLLVVREAADSDPLLKSPTPRGWTRTQEILNNCSLTQGLIEQLLAGVIGPQAAASFLGYLRTRGVKVPDTRLILEDFPAVREEFEALVAEERLDILHLLMKKIVLSMEMKPGHLKNIDAMLGCMSEETAVLFYKQLAVKRPEDFNTAAEQLPSFEPLADRMVDILAG